MSDRERELEMFKHALNTTGGKAFVDELETVWDVYNLLGETPEKTAYNVGLRDAFKFIKDLQLGRLKYE